MRSSLLHVFGIPSLLAVLSLVGLISALLADGFGDVVSWLTLGAVNAVVFWHWLKPVK